jgi:hypothetical protein
VLLVVISVDLTADTTCKTLPVGIAAGNDVTLDKELLFKVMIAILYSY